MFTGNPDHIIFYSGEVGSRFNFKDRLKAEGIPLLKFKTARNTGVQPNSLALLVSSDFQGVVNASSDPLAISTATWTDITNRATWATSSTAVASTAIDLSDFANGGKPVYIAFKYTASAGTVQNKWTITELSLRNQLNDGSSYVIDTLPTFTTVANYGNTSTLPGWVSKKISNSYNWTLSATNMVIAGASTVAAATDPAEAWVITGPIDLKRVTPDAGTVVKSMADLKPTHTYNYQNTGTYEAVFVANQANKDQQESVTRKLSITVK
jgi:hypothetical protein